MKEQKKQINNSENNSNKKEQSSSENNRSSKAKSFDRLPNKKVSKISSSSLTAVIRISGIVGVPEHIENTLYRLRLRRKYVCVVINTNNKSIQGALEKVKFYIAYGEISKETHDKLIKARGKKVDGKLKPFFRLHPPRGGIKSKLQYPKGVLGNNKKDINKLIERML
jgi:large subunit ribosomal protein L30